MLILKNTKENREIRRVTATMAVEGMYFDKEFLLDMVKVTNGEKASGELRKEIIRTYAK